jgi:RNA polymerase sigma-70 factor (ECF subfamily)
VDTSEQSELDLVRRVAVGDQQAFLSLYDHYATRVYALTLHILSDPMLAEEATQDTFLKLWGRARLFVPERGSFGVWLLTIARRTSLDRLRLESRRPLLSDGRDPDAVWHGMADATHDAAEARWQSLHFAVLGLPDDQRLVIDLAYYRGLSHSEIAAELGWPLGTVKTRIRAAMQALRRVWSDEDLINPEGTD